MRNKAEWIYSVPLLKGKSEDIYTIWELADKIGIHVSAFRGVVKRYKAKGIPLIPCKHSFVTAGGKYYYKLETVKEWATEIISL